MSKDDKKKGGTIKVPCPCGGKSKGGKVCPACKGKGTVEGPA